MCGIGGLLGVHRAGFVDFMKRSLRHRGPDGAVDWSEGQVALVQTRLAINDLTESGSQPFHSRDGRYVAMYNGEVYNHESLREEYQLEVAACDGAVLPELWSMKGPAALGELRGMYAMCVHDRTTHRTWLAADPIGMKPLYVRTGSDGTAFASESLALARYFGDATVSPESQALFEAWGCLPSERSGIEGIDRLAPGEVREYDEAGVEVSRTSTSLLPWRRDTSTWSDVVSAFVEAVELHLMSDVPLGLMLSAGVDSAAIAWAAAEAGRTLDCFTLDFAGSPGEGDGAASIARTYGHNHEVLRADPDVAELAREYLGKVDRPTCDGLNVYLISKVMRAGGLKVALAGTGGDEILAGYEHHRRRLTLPSHVNRGAIRAARAALGRLGQGESELENPRGLLQEQVLKALHGIARGGLAADSPSRVRGYRAQHPDHRVVEEAPRRLPFSQLAGPSPVNDLTRAEWAYYLSPMLLPDADVFSMAVGMELRLPFVDLGVLSAVLQVPDRSAGKAAFVEAIGDPLLKTIASRPKTGFELPMSRWLRSVESEWLRDSPNPALTGIPESRRRAELGAWKRVVWDAWERRLGVARFEEGDLAGGPA